MNFECGCERGGDCTRVSVCTMESALDDQAEEFQHRIDELEAKLDAAKSFSHSVWTGEGGNNAAFEKAWQQALQEHKKMSRNMHRNGVECVHGKFLHESCDACEQEQK